MSASEPAYPATETSDEPGPPEIVLRVPPDVLVEWDARLNNLWNPSLQAALESARELYTFDGQDEMILAERAEEMSTTFWRTLTSSQARLPESPESRYLAVVKAIWAVLRAVRKNAVVSSLGQDLLVALRPVRKLRAGVMTAEVCAALYDFHAGIWEPYLDKPQRWRIRTALAKTIAALPPEDMNAYWDNLSSADPMLHGAMLLGLEFLRSAHAVPHLLRGLEQSQDHATRAAIVDCLEEIADPRALATLIRLRQETAHDDWTLSRHIARAIRVIEQQNRGQQHRTLLRPAQTPPDDPDALLRPAADTPEAVARRAEADQALLRPTGSVALPDEPETEPEQPPS